MAKTLCDSGLLASYVMNMMTTFAFSEQPVSLVTLQIQNGGDWKDAADAKTGVKNHS